MRLNLKPKAHFLAVYIINKKYFLSISEILKFLLEEFFCIT